MSAQAHCIEGTQSRPSRRARARRAFSAKRVGWTVLAVVVLAATFAYLPGHVDELKEELRRIQAGDPRWLGFAAALEVVSFAGYVVLFRAVFSSEREPLGWGMSYQITMAGVIATRLLAAAGAGGVALTAWALRRTGMEAATVARRMVAFLVLLYSVYVIALVVCGLGLYTGLFPGEAPDALTLPPAALGAVAILVGLGAAALPNGLGRNRRNRLLHAAGRWLTTVAGGIRDALRMLRDRPLAAIGSPVWWGFDIAVLWACFKAFGVPPAVGVVILAYFVGTLGNLLPLPGGVGGVDGGIIAALIGFGVAPGLAVLAVLAHRVFAFWLPTLPGAVAYFQLRRSVDRWESEPAAA